MRQFVVISQQAQLNAPDNIPYLAFEKTPEQPHIIPFNDAKRLLGQEYPCAIYDVRVPQGICLNLEALAIVAGTIQRSGTLYLICPDWPHLEQHIDLDSQRWNNGVAIPTPLFYRYFKQRVADFGFRVATRGRFTVKPYTPLTTLPNGLTAEQHAIFSHLPTDPADIHFITAPRGRGKSTLAGQLAQQLSAQYDILITARSHRTLPSFWRQIENKKIAFFAPDKLTQLIESKLIAQQKWLFIDEAASLPLPQLQRFCHYFDKIILTSTTHNYEGTGRGFPQKLVPQLKRPVKHWQLNQPLRWHQDDPLEAFIHQLLLLTPTTRGQFDAEIDQKLAVYQLLADAHYKTTPTDLRRLFDAPDQQFYTLHHQQRLLAAAWAIPEGNLDASLSEAIWRGERRPPGNLVAQYLCFQANLPEACRLRSLRLSRLAVQPDQQRQGYGKRLVSHIISQIDPQVDFISVSFGLNAGLFDFWQQCGFQLVQITPTLEASSGYHSAMMLYPLSQQGHRFCHEAKIQFERDFPLLPFSNDLQCFVPKRPPASQALTQADWRNLNGFLTAKRTFSACYASLSRLALHFPDLEDHLRPYLSPQPFQCSKTAQNTLRDSLSQLIPLLEFELKS